MFTAIYPGSFDPITMGHLDIIQRASRIVDHLYVTVFPNISKQPLLTVEERVELIRESVGDLANVSVEHFDGLLIDYAKSKNVRVIIKGLRAVSDFLFEFQMALMNKKMYPELDTIFMMSSAEYSYLSSSIVREIALLGGCIKGLVPENVERKLKEKIRQKGGTRQWT
ncbi:MAG: pantetheine-phosphate adenylyltransferase [Bacillota bacterium]